MATYAIGDVQGCHDELLQLLTRLQFEPASDQLWFTGDLVGRGPQPLETLRFIHSLGEDAITVLGNHDLHCLAQAAGVKQRGKQDTSLKAVLQADDRDSLLDWLRQRPLLHYDEALGFGLLHAGLPPQWDLATAQQCAAELESVLRSDNYRDFLTHMYGELPDVWEPGLSGMQRLRFITNCLTRLRYCDADGRLALQEKHSPAQAPAGLTPWFASPQRQSTNVRWLFGHWSTLGQVDWPEHAVYGLDSGCLWGGALTALCLETGEITQFACAGHLTPGS